MIKIERPKCPWPQALSGKDQKQNYKHPKNKSALEKSSNGKCVYCEDRLGSNSYSRIDHIKPTRLFPDLKFDWNNHAFSCEVCNNIKGDKYDKQYSIINPYDEDPEEYIKAFGGKIDPKDNSKKGKITISRKSGLDLNRSGLLEERTDCLKLIKKIIENAKKYDENTLKDVIDDLEKEALPDKKYSLCVKSYLEAEKLELEGK